MKHKNLWGFMLSHQYCHIFLACSGRLHRANVNTTTISILTTPLRALSTLFVEWADICWWCCRWTLWVRHVVTPPRSDSTETWSSMGRYIFCQLSSILQVEKLTSLSATPACLLRLFLQWWLLVEFDVVLFNGMLLKPFELFHNVIAILVYRIYL